MKKTLLIAVVIAIIIAAGWYFWNKSSAPKAAPDTSEATPEMAPLPSIEEKTGVISSIKDAIGLGKKLACTYTSTGNSAISSTVFIDGQKTKTIAAVNGETMYGIFDGKTQYTWTTGANKQGFKMDKSCMEELKTLAPQAAAPTPAPIQDYDSFDAAQNVSCTAAEEEDFSIPSDITFVDQCEMIKSSMETLDQMKQKLPDGVKIPGVSTPPTQY
ncbi:MAG: hypothetical protein PHT88_04245 [Candidatus Moranbacteria bacterium]|nr:hypothetical protein [Candidatus Moranbacteria bacterium]